MMDVDDSMIRNGSPSDGRGLELRTAFTHWLPTVSMAGLVLAVVTVVAVDAQLDVGRNSRRSEFQALLNGISFGPSVTPSAFLTSGTWNVLTASSRPLPAAQVLHASARRGDGALLCQASAVGAEDESQGQGRDATFR